MVACSWAYGHVGFFLPPGASALPFGDFTSTGPVVRRRGWYHRFEAQGTALQAAAVTKDMGLQFEVYFLDGDKIMLVELNGKTGEVTKSSEVDELGMHPETKTAAIETKTTAILKEKVTDKP